MVTRRKPYQEPLKASLCRGCLRETSDELRYTNGHWAVRKHLCKIIKSTPLLDSFKPDLGVIPMRSSEEYQTAVINTSLTLQGLHPVMVGDGIAAWIDPQYAEAWDRGAAYVAGELDPILFGGQTLADSYAVVMPARPPLDKARAKALRAWLAKVK